ncbi:hypothetical protein BGZ63DRAFT_250399 [Mariannaea sp. PMI_226]|nr:hypothetical protein BGZ63DRAFT_250399 [Mariannaea sp. PMI_226]
MQFLKATLFSIVALLSATGEACKCYRTEGGTNNGATHKCCNDLGGVWQYGNDCKAGSISEHLRAFDHCCKGQGSDCDYPRLAQSDDVEDPERAANHVEIRTVVHV